MARYSGKKQVSEQSRLEAMAIAKGTQSAGQTKEQTRLIAKGIERGIDIYKKQQKEKARELDRRLRAQRQAPIDAGKSEPAAPAATAPEAPARNALLPWLLLGLTWAGIVAYGFFLRAYG